MVGGVKVWSWSVSMFSQGYLSQKGSVWLGQEKLPAIGMKTG